MLNTKYHLFTPTYFWRGAVLFHVCGLFANRTTRLWWAWLYIRPIARGMYFITFIHCTASQCKFIENIRYYNTTTCYYTCNCAVKLFKTSIFCCPHWLFHTQQRDSTIHTVLLITHRISSGQHADCVSINLKRNCNMLHSTLASRWLRLSGNCWYVQF